MATTTWSSLGRSGMYSAEVTIGLLAASAGLLGSLISVLAVGTCLSQALARHHGAARIEHVLAGLTPKFLQRAATLALSAGLALSSTAAGVWAGPASHTAGPPSHATPAVVLTAEASDPGLDTALFRERHAEETQEKETPMSGLFTPHQRNSTPETKPPRDASGSAEEVLVRPGDTLWDIAAEHLGSGATDGEVAESWPRWYETNRHTIGDDPALIQPGMVLLPPT
ncbi:LysM peptidoglycan-binding domain-containing protein [Nesterenkonia sp. Act20]|uniref:LysM peptidoglycan-binding domain-containing protein n=1 Tax=Nesterenkonia sp. Act20 TaxID=1483432 RepID=UPI001C4952B2|nr:LysM domain-containing protein [Nesterenkonia sp. Act20]